MFTELLSRATRQLKNELPFVLYSKPREPILKAVFQADDIIYKVQNYTEQGFVFAPFLADEDPILLKSKEVLQTPLELGSRKVTALIEEAQGCADEEARYNAMVEKAISGIRAGNCKKIVLSRNFKVPLSKTVFVIFQELLETYPTAFCYLWYHPKVGMWLGATPEILVKTSGLNFTTMSLAGTQNQTVGGEQPIWEPKEIDEQQLVTDYIAEVLKSRAKEVHVADAETIKAGHLWHLRSKITGRFAKGMLKDLITALHPTPAVCGLPLKEAKRFILDNEAYERGYYTGFLGELNYKEERTRNRNQRNQENSAYRSVVRISELFVNLRCMQRVGNSLHIYVGGGITLDSDPKKEWEETESKAQTMLRLLTT